MDPEELERLLAKARAMGLGKASVPYLRALPSTRRSLAALGPMTGRFTANLGDIAAASADPTPAPRVGRPRLTPEQIQRTSTRLGTGAIDDPRRATMTESSKRELDIMNRMSENEARRTNRFFKPGLKALAPFAKIAGPVGVAYDALRSEPAVASTEVPPGGYFYERQAYPSMQADYAQPVLGEAGMMTGMDVAPDAGGAVGGGWADPPSLYPNQIGITPPAVERLPLSIENLAFQPNWDTMENMYAQTDFVPPLTDTVEEVWNPTGEPYPTGYLGQKWNDLVDTFTPAKDLSGWNPTAQEFLSQPFSDQVSTALNYYTGGVFEPTTTSGVQADASQAGTGFSTATGAGGFTGGAQMYDMGMDPTFADTGGWGGEKTTVDLTPFAAAALPVGPALTAGGKVVGAGYSALAKSLAAKGAFDPTKRALGKILGGTAAAGLLKTLGISTGAKKAGQELVELVWDEGGIIGPMAAKVGAKVGTNVMTKANADKIMAAPNRLRAYAEHLSKVKGTKAVVPGSLAAATELQDLGINISAEDIDEMTSQVDTFKDIPASQPVYTGGDPMLEDYQSPLASPAITVQATQAEADAKAADYMGAAATTEDMLAAGGELGGNWGLNVDPGVKSVVATYGTSLDQQVPSDLTGGITDPVRPTIDYSVPAPLPQRPTPTEMSFPVAAPQPAGPSAADIERQKQAAINARFAQEAAARQQQQFDAVERSMNIEREKGHTTASEVQAAINAMQGLEFGGLTSFPEYGAEPMSAAEIDVAGGMEFGGAGGWGGDR